MKKNVKILELFAGIGGFSLGLSHAGLEIAKTNRYTMIGNAVTVDVVEAIGHRLLNLIHI